MRGLVWFLVVAALAVGLALLARMNEGYVLIVAPPYRVEISLTLFVILFASTFAFVYWLLRLVIHTLRMPAYVASFRRRQRVGRATEALRGSLLAYFEGRFGKSEKLAARAFELGESPPLAAILAARSAHFLRDPERRDAWLDRAESAASEGRVARLATRAELLLDERRFEEAREVLTELHSNGARHVVTLRLLMRAEQGLGHWDEVLRISRQLEKRSAVTPEFARQMEVTATVESLRRKALSTDEIRQFWRTVPSGLQHERRVAATAARLFMRLGDCRTAHAIVRAALESQWDEELVRLFGECAASDSLERLDQAEKWLERHPRDPALLLTLGRLCLERELWGKAQSYLEASIAESPSRDAHLELARLFDRLERAEEAGRHYRAAADVGIAA
jgi:HemY protein